jgi:type II secretory pathway component PulF
MISDESLLDFCRALEAAVRSGLPLSDAFQTLAKSRAHGRLVARAARLTAGGAALHEALSAQGIFPPVFIALVRAGEAGGKTDEFLGLFAGCLEVRVDFRRRIKRALIYPAFVALLAGALFLAVSFKAVPILLGPLLGAGLALPPPALWLADLAGRAQAHWQLAAAGIVTAWLAVRAMLRSGAGRKAWSLAGHWLPVFSYATRQARLHNIYTTMALLFKAGVPLSTLMDVLLQFSQDDPVTRRRFLRAAAMLNEGISFAGSLGGWIPEEDRGAMEIAEKSGRLEETLLRLGKAHYDLHLHRLKVLTTGFTITATVALAPVCFGLILAILQPVLAIMKGATNLSTGGGSFGAAAPLTPAQDASGVSRSAPEEEKAADSKTALFNKLHGQAITGFMKEHSPLPGKARDGAAAPEKQESSEPAKKLAPMPKIKKFQSKSIAPTSIEPTDLNSGR